jgi:hypothetical protein
MPSTPTKKKVILREQQQYTKPIYLVYHTYALHTYQKVGNFETNNTLRV